MTISSIAREPAPGCRLLPAPATLTVPSTGRRRPPQGARTGGPAAVGAGAASPDPDGGADPGPGVRRGCPPPRHRPDGSSVAIATAPPPTRCTPMSADSEQLERSALERKDRDELMTIATALGGKPGSRAKKADIIDLVLELTGVSAGAADAAGSADAEAVPGDTTTPTIEEPATPAPEGTDDAPPGRTRRPRRTKEKPPSTTAASTETGDEKATEPTPADGGSAADTTPTATPDATSADTGAATSTETAAAASSQKAASGPDGSDTAAGDTPEPGRRRRRRGRDRNSDRGERSDRPDEVVAAEPAEVEGLLDLRDEGYGFLRVNGYLPCKDDVYVSVKQTRQFAPASWRPHQRHQPPGDAQREEPGAAAHRRRQRRRRGRRTRASSLRRPHAAVPRRAAAPRERVEPLRHDGADHRPDLPRSARASADSSSRRPRRARRRS